MQLVRVGRHPVLPAATAVAGLGATTAWCYALAWAMTEGTYDLWTSMIIGPILLLLTWPVAKRTAAVEADNRLVSIIMWAVVLKLVASLLRYLVAVEVYGGSADAGVYITHGAVYAEQVRGGVLDFAPGHGGSSGTRFIIQLTGLIFAVTGPTGIGGFLIFAWMGFWGLYFFYRAFAIGVPDGDRRRYALLVFFLPSLLYWPASVGKDAWMLLTLGLASFGVARILSRRRGGHLLTALGLSGASAVRPHLAVLIAAGLLAAWLVRASGRRSSVEPLVKILGIGLTVAALAVAVRLAQDRFDVTDQGLGGAGSVLERTADQTNKGGSAFETTRPTSPIGLAGAVFTVMFRPLPYEAHNLQMLATSFEGVLLLGLFFTSRTRLRAALSALRRTPYVSFALVYSGLFMLAFSSFGNFGILARQRAQMFPLILIVLALPIVPRAARNLPDLSTSGWAAR